MTDLIVHKAVDDGDQNALQSGTFMPITTPTGR